jgi:hypothetical protein
LHERVSLALIEAFLISHKGRNQTAADPPPAENGKESAILRR